LLTVRSGFNLTGARGIAYIESIRFARGGAMKRFIEGEDRQPVAPQPSSPSSFTSNLPATTIALG
jgi:hypothetical protein